MATATHELRPPAVRLIDLPTGTSARLFATRLDEGTRALLRALGLTDASTLRVCKRGEPFIIQVRDTRIGISGVVAGSIDVVVEGPSPTADSRCL